MSSYHTDRPLILLSLPVYHMKCIDPWLTKNRRVCPVCKGKVVLPGITDPTDSESEAENGTTASERTPLVSNTRRPSRWRRIRRSRPAVTAVTNPAETGSELPVAVTTDTGESSSSPPAGGTFPVVSGHLSVNSDEREVTGQEGHQSSTSSITTSVVVDVETRPANPGRGSRSHSRSGRSGRRTRRNNDAIV
jgi:hypothetical protein